MAIPADVQAKINVLKAHLTSVFVQINNIQESNKIDNGRYWQGLKWTYGQASPPAAAGNMSWEDRGVLPYLPSESGVSIQVNEYLGPSGTGWEIQAYIDQDNRSYMVTRNFGPETHREQDWFEFFPNSGWY